MIAIRRSTFFVLIASVVVKCLASDTLSCAFNRDSGICNYEDKSNVTAWSIENSGIRESSAIDGPLNSETDYLQLINRKGRLQSSTVKLFGVHCITLDYYLLTSRGNVSIYASRLDKWTPRNPYRRRQYYPLFNRNEKSSYLDAWQHHEKILDFENAEYFITIEAQTSINGTIAISNLAISEGACSNFNTDVRTCDFDGIVGSRLSNTRNANLPLNCDWFSLNGDLKTVIGGGWSVLVEDDIIRDKPYGRMTSSYDVSTRTSFGGFLRGGVPWGGNPLEIVLNTFYPQDGAQCLSFWIQEDFQTGRLPRWEVTETAIDTNVLLSNANLLIKWRFEQVNIDPVVPMVIKIRLFSGNTKIDAMKLARGKCPATNSCDFQNGNYCGFAPYFSNWFIGRGRLERPSSEINKQLGYNKDYYYTDFSTISRKESFASWISSNIVREPGDYCFRFHFQTEHPKIIKTVVHISTKPQENIFNLQVVYDDDSNTNGTWRRGLVDIKKMRAPFYVELKVDLPFEHRHWYNGLTTLQIREIAIEKKTCNEIRNPKIDNPQFSQVNFHCHQTGHYIPKYRTCDGVIDCPMGEDESEQCNGGPECSNGGIPCKRRGHRFCLIDATQFCNEVIDCDDGIDEDPRMCNAESFCDNYCLNDGKCLPTSFECVCVTRFNGKRCQLELAHG